MKSEKFYQQHKEERDIVQETRQEIQELKNKAEALQEKGEYYDPHLDFINPDLITQKGAELWRKLYSVKSLEEYDEFVKDLEKYRKESRDAEKAEEGEQNSDLYFTAYLGNKAFGILNKLNLERDKKEKE